MVKDNSRYKFIRHERQHIYFWTILEGILLQPDWFIGDLHRKHTCKCNRRACQSYKLSEAQILGCTTKLQKINLKLTSTITERFLGVEEDIWA